MSKNPRLTPEAIQARSFEIISELLPDCDQTASEWPIIRRIVHTAGDPFIAGLVRIHPRAVAAGVGALLAGRPILTDVRMLAAGINRRLCSRFGCEVICANDSYASHTPASTAQLTRSAAAIASLSHRIPGSIVAVGNAPTALFAVLELLEGGLEPPALIVGTPVGFVGAAESKQELIEIEHPGLAYVTVEGTRGGSAIAVATVNALLHLAAEESDRQGDQG